MTGVQVRKDLQSQLRSDVPKQQVVRPPPSASAVRCPPGLGIFLDLTGIGAGLLPYKGHEPHVNIQRVRTSYGVIMCQVRMTDLSCIRTERPSRWWSLGRRMDPSP